MDTQDKEGFVNNVNWFNHFFEDLRNLFGKINEGLGAKFPIEKHGHYYPRYKYLPSIPPYFVMGLRGGSFAVQVFAILDPLLFEDNPAFKAEPCLVVVKHSSADHWLWIEDFGLRFIRNYDIEPMPPVRTAIAGKTPGDEGAQFYGFQILFDEFSPDKNVDEVIQREVVNVLRELPDW